MKTPHHKVKKKTSNFMDYDESHHVYSKTKTNKQRKANNMIDKLLKRKDFESINKLEDVY